MKSIYSATLLFLTVIVIASVLDSTLAGWWYLFFTGQWKSLGILSLLLIWWFIVGAVFVFMQWLKDKRTQDSRP